MLTQVADATAKRATADKGNLTLRCEAQLGTIERRLAKLQGDQEIVTQLSQWLTSIADEWGDATMLAQLTSLISKLKRLQPSYWALVTDQPSTECPPPPPSI